MLQRVKCNLQNVLTMALGKARVFHFPLYMKISIISTPFSSWERQYEFMNAWIEKVLLKRELEANNCCVILFYWHW